MKISFSKVHEVKIIKSLFMKKCRKIPSCLLQMFIFMIAGESGRVKAFTYRGKM